MNLLLKASACAASVSNCTFITYFCEDKLDVLRLLVYVKGVFIATHLNSTVRRVELRRYRHFADARQLDVEWS